MKRSGRGFTVIEMLLVTSLLAMVGLAVFQALSNGIQIWQRGKNFSREEDVAIFLDKFSTDLHNTFYFSQLPFKGRKTTVTFATIIRTRIDRRLAATEVSYTDMPGLVEYSFDPMSRKVKSRQANYSQALDKQFGPWRDLVAPVEKLEFAYICRDEKNETMLCKNPEKDVPLAILVEIQYRESTGGIRALKRLVTIPVATARPVLPS